MKKISMLLIVCFVVVSTGAFAQLKVNSSGKVGIGVDPYSNYYLTTFDAIFKTSPSDSYPHLIISTTDVGYGRAMFPSINNSCKLGKSGNAFSGIWTYALTNLSDGRQKENIAEIHNALATVMKLKGVKYDIKRNILTSLMTLKIQKMLPGWKIFVKTNLVLLLRM